MRSRRAAPARAASRRTDALRPLALSSRSGRPFLVIGYRRPAIAFIVRPPHGAPSPWRRSTRPGRPGLTPPLTIAFAQERAWAGDVAPAARGGLEANSRSWATAQASTGQASDGPGRLLSGRAVARSE